MGVDAEQIMSNNTNSHETRASASDYRLSVDDLFDVLVESRRRTVLAVLTDRRSPMAVETLARAVAEREHDDISMAPSESAVEDVHVTLHHVHLPKLDESRLVDYDRNERTVAPTDVADEVPIDLE